MQYNDSDFGLVTLTVNHRARSIIMRAEIDGLRVTIPYGISIDEVRKVIDKHRQSLKEKQNLMQENHHTVDFTYTISTDMMHLSIISGNRKGCYINRSEGKCEIIVPADFDFNANQAWIRNVITEELRIQAKVILYNKCIAFAKQFGFKIKDIKIQSSRSRWGSCSGSNSINLSLFIMTLPSHLADYVILHELCHTVHHDHSAQFWKLMDKVTNNKAHALREELHNFKTEI